MPDRKYALIRAEHAEGVATLTLDNPQIGDLTALAGWTNLNVLTICGGHGDLERLEGIEQLDQLHTLRLLNYLYI